MSAISELLERVEKATPSNSRAWRQLEIDLCEHFTARAYGSMPCEDYAARYLSSLDAVIALVEAKLPGVDWRVQKRDGDNKSSAIISREHPTKHFDIWTDQQGATPALALIAALLRALEEQKP